MSLFIDVEAIAAGNLNARLWVLVFPFLAAIALIGVATTARARRDNGPFRLTIVFFIASYLTLGLMVWPSMASYSLTVADAAAPDQSLGFIFYAAIVVLPVMLTYAAVVFYVFRGKPIGSFRSLT